MNVSSMAICFVNQKLFKKSVISLETIHLKHYVDRFNILNNIVENNNNCSL